MHAMNGEAESHTMHVQEQLLIILSSPFNLFLAVTELGISNCSKYIHYVLGSCIAPHKYQTAEIRKCQCSGKSLHKAT
jgi:hypothetical protein